MNSESAGILTGMFRKYPDMEVCRESLEEVFKILCSCYRAGGKILVCGNGGSAADSEHIVGELMKSFNLSRPLSDVQREKLKRAYPDSWQELADGLQGAIPAFSLVSQTSLCSAIVNDTSPDMVFAQQVFGYGKPGDVLIGLSTSGNAKNVLLAVKVAKAFDIGTVGLTGQPDSPLSRHCDITIRVPQSITPLVQECHIIVYHTLCAMLEQEFFKA